MVSRYDCWKYLAEIIGDALVCVWGQHDSSEWYNLRPNPPSLRLDMGTATPVSLGLAIGLPHRKVVSLDTDGGILLNLSIISTLGNMQPPNLKVFVMDNECYESIGGAPSATSAKTDLAAMAKGAGIVNARTTRTLEEFKEAARAALNDNAFHFIVAKVEKGAKNLRDMRLDDIELTYRFIRHVEESEKINVIKPSVQKIPDHLIK